MIFLPFSIPGQYRISFYAWTLFLVLGIGEATAQIVTISDDEAYESSSENALLEIHSGSGQKGILIPRIRRSQRLGMDPDSIMDASLMIYETDSKSYWFWNGSKWKNISLPNRITDEDRDTYIETEGIDNDEIQVFVDGQEKVIVDDTVLQIFSKFRLQHGGSVNHLNVSGPLVESDSSLASEQVIKSYVDEQVALMTNNASPFISVERYGANGQDEQDDTEAIQQAIEENPGKSLYFPDGTYYAHINVNQAIHLFSPTGEVRIIGSNPGESVLEVNAPLKMDKLTFIHTDSTTSGSDGITNKGFDIEADHCTFIGWEHDATHRSSKSYFTNCTFTVTFESLGTICWSPYSVFRDCIFDGVIGADVQDSKFYSCSFSGLWGVHMPEGTIDNFGQPTGFKGDAEFYNCEIRGSWYYAIGLGNAAHPKLYNCFVSGHNSGTYARTESTYEAYNCYVEAYRNGGASTAVKFSKYPTQAQSAIGLVPRGDSFYSNCRFVNVGSAGGYHVIVPARDDGGSVTFSNCSFNLDNVCAELPNIGCTEDIFLYINVPENESQKAPETLEVSNNELLTPKYNYSGVSMLNVKGNSGAVSGVKLSKYFSGNKEFPIGYQVILQGLDDSKTVQLVDGYDGPNGVGINLIEPFTTLGQGDCLVLTYVDNFWVQTSPFVTALGGSPDISPPQGAAPVSGSGERKSHNTVLIQQDISHDGALDFEIPAGHKITSFVIHQNGNIEHATINIGTSPSHSDVLDQVSIANKELIDCQLDKTLFSLESPQKLYITSPDWQRNQLTIYVKTESFIK